MQTHTRLLTLLLLPTFAISARAYDAILTTEHVDLGLAYVGGAWDLHVHDETNLAEYAPSNALLYVDAITKTTRPAGSQWDFFGNNAGEDLWVLPFTQNPNALYLGIGAEETAPGTFATYTESDTRLGATALDRTGEWVKLTLNAVNGPGHLALYTFDGFNPVVWWSSSQGGISAGDAAYAVAGGHNHYFWAFTAPGIYEVDVTASAFFGPGATNPTSDSATYHFGVETVPEPGSAMLLGLGLAAIGLRRAVAA